MFPDRFGMLGSVDSNTGSPDLGWDTDQFPMEVKNTTLVMKVSSLLSCNQSFAELKQHINCAMERTGLLKQSHTFKYQGLVLF